MKKLAFRIAAFTLVYSLLSACGASKTGCPSNSSSMGAERVLAGEKPEKQSKFKIKGMN